MVRIGKIKQVQGNDYVMKRCNELSLEGGWGKLRRSIVKNAICSRMEKQVKKKENVYVLGKLNPK